MTEDLEEVFAQFIADYYKLMYDFKDPAENRDEPKDEKAGEA